MSCWWWMCGYLTIHRPTEQTPEQKSLVSSVNIFQGTKDHQSTSEAFCWGEVWIGRWDSILCDGGKHISGKAATRTIQETNSHKKHPKNTHLFQSHVNGFVGGDVEVIRRLRGLHEHGLWHHVSGGAVLTRERVVVRALLFRLLRQRYSFRWRPVKWPSRIRIVNRLNTEFTEAAAPLLLHLSMTNSLFSLGIQIRQKITPQKPMRHLVPIFASQCLSNERKSRLSRFRRHRFPSGYRQVSLCLTTTASKYACKITRDVIQKGQWAKHCSLKGQSAFWLHTSKR